MIEQCICMIAYCDLLNVLYMILHTSFICDQILTILAHLTHGSQKQPLNLNFDAMVG